MRIADPRRMPKPRSVRRWCVAVALFLMAAARADAQSVTLAWDSNSESDLAGYIIGYGTISGQNQKTVDVGMATQWTVSGLSSGQTYYFRVFAYNTSGAKSAPSQEVSTTTPGSGPTSGGCIGQPPADGWVCINGGWVPPDSPLNGGGSPTPEPAPAPAPTGCSGSAPGAGWVCQDGGWLPPDSPLLWGSPTAPACPGSAPGVMWTCVDGVWVAPPAGGCSGPDPFATLGGGTCVNGGWLPPGMSGSGTPPAPPKAPTTSNCATPDPFVSLGGGTCYNGGWLPPGAPTTGSGTTSCSGNSPGLGWICQDGGWLPPGHPLIRRSGGQ